MNDIITSFTQSLQTIVTNLREELKGIRTGRAHTGMLESLPVEAYGGTKMRLIELASLTIEGTAALQITPFDPGTVKDIEKAIMASPLGLNPQTEGNRIIVRIPPLTEEQRVKFTKLVSQIVEDAKNRIRRARDDARKQIKAMEDRKEIMEDERYRMEKEIDKQTTETNEELQSLKEKKEQEIMEV